MSGYVTLVSPCIVCGRLFASNPNHVPSTTMFTGKREPICEDCFNAINARRRMRGQEPFPLHPQAYEPLPEEELHE
jgi:hypothetical protein